MPTTHCYHCGNALTPTTRSQEHIIPNAIGGRWKSRELWCSTCNKEFGSTMDAVLCRDLMPVASLLEIERERGENPLIRNATTASGERYHLGKGSTPIRNKPTVNIDKEKQTVHISARNKAEMLLLIKQLKQKYPGLDDSDLESKFNTSDDYLSEPVTIKMQISGPAFSQAVLKIAISAWLDNTHDAATIASALADLHRSPDNMQTYIRHYYTPELCKNVTDDSVEHIIYIKGEQDKSLLYAYVELFSSYAFVINLNDHYTGPTYHFLFRQDVLTGTHSDQPPSLQYTGTLPGTENLNNIFIDLLQFKLNRVLAIADERATSQQIRKIAEDAFKGVMSRYPQGTDITAEMVKQIEEDTIRRAKAFAAHVKKTRSRR